MNTVLQAIREVLGTPTFYHQMTNSTSYTWDYGLMLEYIVAAAVMLIVISNVFRLLNNIFAR